LTPANVMSLVAATIASSSWPPQLSRMFRRRQAADISWWHYGALEAGCAAWLLYGATIGSPGLIADNGVWCVLVGAALLVKARADRMASPGLIADNALRYVLVGAALLVKARTHRTDSASLLADSALWCVLAGAALLVKARADRTAGA
jgi:uncharacterized protein with PQ loop repeat